MKKYIIILGLLLSSFRRICNPSGRKRGFEIPTSIRPDYKSVRTVALTILFASFSVSLMAQEPLNLSVQDCIDMALENNIELKNSQLEIDKARATKNEARAEYFPTVSAQALAFDALNPMISFGIEDIDNAQLRQLLYTLYAEYGANMGIDKEYSFVQNGVMLNAMATEPIYAGGRIRNGNKLAKLGIDAAETQAK